MFVIKPILDAIFGYIGGFTFGGGAAHAPVNAQAVRGVQHGGNVLGGQPYVVGESGP